ncbi:MAG TPA: DUF3996 domain-containing protein [Kofleriaceae bacterium]|nr:DUF3996 domain-containing protein [Kofleriaceae bacterium]
MTIARNSCALILSVALVGATAASAGARPRPRKASDFQANKEFGLGIMFGAPTGLTAKWYTGKDTALDFGLGVYHHFYYHDAFHIHADFLWHPAVLAKADPFWLALYFGVGGRLLHHDSYYHRGDYFYDDHTHLGARVPVGLVMDFNNIPLDIFFELVPTLDLLVIQNDDRYTDDDHHDGLNFELDGALGARYYF